MTNIQKNISKCKCKGVAYIPSTLKTMDGFYAPFIKHEVINLIRQKIQSVFKNNGYNFFENDSKNYNLNLIGVRAINPKPKYFDDSMIILWKYSGNWQMEVFNMTTDPGIYYLNNPINLAGTGILKCGQYEYRQGKHKNDYVALVQKSEVTLIRDFDRDDEYNVYSGIEETGFFGANIHHAGMWEDANEVGKWSAACQVVQYIDNFNRLMDLVSGAVSNFGNKITYTLINEQELKKN